MDYIDLLLMHWPNPSVPLKETLAAMNELQSAGKIRHIGVSNFSPALVEEAARYATIFCNQVEYHPYEPQDELLAQSREMGYLFVAYTPLARGRVSRDPLLNQIGAKYKKTPEQVTLRWLIQQDVCAIPKAAREVHQRENIAIFDFELSDEEMEAILRLAR